MPKSKSKPSFGNLPIPLSSFFGREHEAGEIRGLLRSNRLVTLTGTGGCGKTRLSIKIAQELSGEFEHGIWLVELASISDPALVPQTIAAALKVRERSGQDLMDLLADSLFDRPVLLVIDNCEHLILACAQIVETLLQKCPDLKILATSREALGLAGEIAWIVQPLSLPEQQPWTNPVSARDAVHSYEGSESVQLFVARAKSIASDFELTEENGAWVAEICRRLDGMPLAIELAAARVRSLTVREIAQRLDDRFNLLTGGSRTGHPRQQTLTATLDWSYTLLSDVEGKVLQRLSVFAGGATLEAVEAVCAGEGVDSEGVLDILSHLLEKSLVIVDKSEGGETQYGLLETIRQYALEKLEGSGELAQARDRHLEYFLRVAESANPKLYSSEEVSWLDRFEAEHDNFRFALEWSRKSEEKTEVWLRLTAALGFFWNHRGYFTEGRERLAAILEKTKTWRTVPRALALYRTAQLAFDQTDYPESLVLLDEALSIYQELGSAGRLGHAHTLIMLGDVWRCMGNYEKSFSLLDQGLHFMRELNDRDGLVRALWQIAYCFVSAGDYQQSERYYSEALQLSRQGSDDLSIATILSGLAEAALRGRDLARAATLEEESLALRRNAGEKWGIAVSLANFAWISLKQNDFEKAASLFVESLAIRREIGDRGGVAWCLEKLAKLNILIGQKKSQQDRVEAYRMAVRLFGAAAALRAPVGSVIDQADMAEYERDLDMLKMTLGTGEFDGMWEEGGGIPFEELFEELSAATAKGSEQKKKEQFGGLTEREREVAALIAQGKSNRDIAKAMTVGIKTVETYVTRILNKLNFDSRVQIATWAVEKGLHGKESE
jgi:predicted ATPase/DNA-binding CsgD family transcriptional regulator